MFEPAAGGGRLQGGGRGKWEALLHPQESQRLHGGHLEPSDVSTLDVAAFRVFNDSEILKGTRGCLKAFLRNLCVMDQTHP